MFDEEDWLFVVIGVMLLVLFGSVAYCEAKDWEQFAKDHKCVVVGRTSSSVVPIVGSDGKVGTAFVSGQTGYKCDDGVTYWR